MFIDSLRILNNNFHIFSKLTVIRFPEKNKFLRNKRNSHLEAFCQRGVLKISQNSQENTCVEASFLTTCRPESCNFIKKRLHHRHFPVNFANLFRTPFS